MAFVVNGSKVTAKTLLKICKYLYQEAKKLEDRTLNPVNKHGKQTVKQLARQNQGMSSVDITDDNIKSFEKYAKKYGVDFALKKDDSGEKPKYIVFFKGRDNDCIQQALMDFSRDLLKQAEKPSVREKLQLSKEEVQKSLVVLALDKTLNKDLSRKGLER